ncbi:Splicing factor 3B subunit 2 [Glycine max]|nr:Splicing factor 3B subunit 2 [Glycine max]
MPTPTPPPPPPKNPGRATEDGDEAKENTDPQQDNDKRDQSVENATTNKKADSDSEEEENVNEQKEKGISNKKKKLQRQMKIAELKQIFSRPDVVEMWDATASDPNCWGAVVAITKRGLLWFLLGKRGIEKPPFQLPDFIAATGIEKIRQAYIEKEHSKKLKQKQRERM